MDDMVVWRKCPMCGKYYPGNLQGGICDCGYRFGTSFKIVLNPFFFILRVPL
jgi:hypothetical protein